MQPVIRKAMLFVRAHPSVCHGEVEVHDVPLGKLESECGPITVLERIEDEHSVYFRVEMAADCEHQNDNEFISIYIRPAGVVLSSRCSEMLYKVPDMALAREVCDQWLLSEDAVLRKHAVQILQWIDMTEGRSPPPAYVLYHDPAQVGILNIVDFLQTVGIDMRPRDLPSIHPAHVTELPAIEDDAGNLHLGFQKCVAFLETHSGHRYLVGKAASRLALFRKGAF